jgi:hypothetical protein
MPATSQQQQKLFGLALAVKRGEVPASEVSDEVKAIVDRMSEKDIEDFAATKHKGLPKMKEQLRKIVREIMREKVIFEMNESVNESAGCGCGCGCGGSKMNESLKADPRKVYGGAGAKEGMVLVKQAGFIKILDLSKKNPSNVFVVSDDNYTNFGPFYVKNGKVAKYTVANPNYDLEKNKVRTVKVPNDVILKFKVIE